MLSETARGNESRHFRLYFAIFRTFKLQTFLAVTDTGDSTLLFRMRYQKQKKTISFGVTLPVFSPKHIISNVFLTVFFAACSGRTCRFAKQREYSGGCNRGKIRSRPLTTAAGSFCGSPLNLRLRCFYAGDDAVNIRPVFCHDIAL